MKDTCLGCDEKECICLEPHESELELDVTYKVDVAGQELTLTEIHFDDLEAAILLYRQVGFRDGRTRLRAITITECGEKQQ